MMLSEKHFRNLISQKITDEKLDLQKLDSHQLFNVKKLKLTPQVDLDLPFLTLDIPQWSSCSHLH